MGTLAVARHTACSVVASVRPYRNIRRLFPQRQKARASDSCLVCVTSSFIDLKEVLVLGLEDLMLDMNYSTHFVIVKLM